MIEGVRQIEAQRSACPPVNPLSIRTGIERSHLETALALQLHGSFGKAATAMCMKTGTVSRRLRALEFQLGTQLFERYRSRLVPTPAGRVFLARTAKLMTGFHTLVEGVRHIASGKAGRISIGYCGPAAGGALHNLLFARPSPAAEIWHEPVELPHGQLHDALLSGRIDFAVVRGKPEFADCRTAEIWNERILVALPGSHPLAQRQSLSWAELAAETFLHSEHDQAPALAVMLKDRLHRLGQQPVSQTCHVSPCSLLQMVAAGLGICLVLESMVRPGEGGVVFVELAGPGGSECIASHGCWRDLEESPALARFLRRHVPLGSRRGSA